VHVEVQLIVAIPDIDGHPQNCWGAGDALTKDELDALVIAVVIRVALKPLTIAYRVPA